ncbi:hypothetical protein E4U17_000067 [Claviceps sp. LM77 group G4]|nr:hypothetical protein E4U17_000067 [Claviceps sp. LM77 group G4]KAG6086663.1 hypothetical protein E4U33_002339 [Claviceps sp. LM78 group G4]
MKPIYCLGIPLWAKATGPNTRPDSPIHHLFDYIGRLMSALLEDGVPDAVLGSRATDVFHSILVNHPTQRCHALHQFFSIFRHDIASPLRQRTVTSLADRTPRASPSFLEPLQAEAEAAGSSIYNLSDPASALEPQPVHRNSDVDHGMAKPTASASFGRPGGGSNYNDSDGSNNNNNNNNNNNGGGACPAALRAHNVLCPQWHLMGQKYALSRLGRVLRCRLDMLFKSTVQEAHGQFFYEAAHGFPHVIVCLDGSYCCDTDGPQCCVEKRGVFLDATGNIAKVAASTMLSWGPGRTSPGYQTADSTDTDTDTAATPPPGPESATSASPRETATGPSRDPGTPSTGEGESDNTALKIGVGVGIPLGLLALGACAALIVVLRRRRRRRRPEMGAAESAVAKKNGKRRWLRLKGARVSVPRELDATSVHRAELPP